MDPPPVKILRLQRRPPLAPRRQRVLVGSTSHMTEDSPPHSAREHSADKGRAPAGVPSVRPATAGGPPVPLALQWASADAREAWRRALARRGANARFGFAASLHDTTQMLSHDTGADERWHRATSQIGADDRARRSDKRARHLATLARQADQREALVRAADQRVRSRDDARRAALVAQRERYARGVQTPARGASARL